MLAILLIPVTASLAPAQGPAIAPLQVTEWTVPWEKTRPRDPYLDAESWISVTPITKSGGLTIRHMIFDAPTRALWFGTDANTIGRAIVP